MSHSVKLEMVLEPYKVAFNLSLISLAIYLSLVVIFKLKKQV